jgi:hypothetical protein
MVELDLGAVARYRVAWERWKRPSGRPTRSKASAAATTTRSALGSARPMSSLAKISMRRKMNLGSSPAYTILASQ